MSRAARLLLIVLAVGLLVACQSPHGPTEPALTLVAPVETLRVAYPDTLEPLVASLASAYQRADPTVQIVLVQRADTLALQALEAGEVDVALLTWMPFEPPQGLWATPVARDGLAVVVNPQNGIPGLTLDQLRQLFQGQREDWAEWGGLPGAPQVVSREDAAGDYVFFQVRVMGDARVTLTAYLAPTTDAVLDLVGNQPLAVGYMSTARLDGRVRALAIDSVPPAPEMLSAGHYPLSRDIVLATLGEPQSAARAFAQWALSADGQAVMTRQGFLSPQP